jgi:predicted DNA-binding protein
VRHAKLTAFRLTEADRAYLDTLGDKLGFTKTDIVRLALRRLAELEGLELIEKSGPRRLPRRV